MRLEAKVFFSILLLTQVAFAIKTILEVFDDELLASIEKYITEMEDDLPKCTFGWIPSVDRFINTVLVMFRNFFLTTLIQWSLLKIWFGGFLPTLVWMNMEQERTGMVGAVVYFTLYQFGGISVFYPLVCIYLLFSAHKSSSKTNFANPLSSALQVISVVIPIIGLLFFKSFQDQCSFLLLFLLGPCIVPLFSEFFFPKLEEVPPQRMKKARFYYIGALTFAGGVGFCLHFMGVFLALGTYGPIDDFNTDRFYADLVTHKVHNFMWVDFTITYLTTFLMVLANGGFISFVLVLLGSVVFGPAVPLALFYIKLELDKAEEVPTIKKTN